MQRQARSNRKRRHGHRLRPRRQRAHPGEYVRRTCYHSSPQHRLVRHRHVKGRAIDASQIVGHKPTWGLVPYTGIISGEATIDHAGPMARTVRDCALLLDAIAGPDGIDDRQPPFLPSAYMEYTKHLDDFASGAADAAKPLQGVKVGVLKEGFSIPNMDKSIAGLCSAAVEKLKDLGATVTDVSIPSHTSAVSVWACSLPIAGGRQGSLSDMTGRKQLFMTDRIAKAGRELSQQAWEASGPGAQNQYLRYLFVEEKYGAVLHAKVSNLLRKINVCASGPAWLV